MPGENFENQKDQIKRNPTRFDTDRGENEKLSDKNDISSDNGKNTEKKFTSSENDLDGSGSSGAFGGEKTSFAGPEAGVYDDQSDPSKTQIETQQSHRQSGSTLGREKNEVNEAGAGADYGTASQHGEDVMREKKAQGIDEDKQTEGGSHKGAQIPGAFGKENKNSGESLNEGM